MPQPSLFLFRRDLRLHDNTGLLHALAQGAPVLAAFIFDPRQTEPHPYRSEPGFAFLLNALQALDHELRASGGRLHCFQGPPEDVLKALIPELSSVHVNRDFTPFSRQRDQQLEALCQEHGTPWTAHNDLLLLPPEAGVKANGSPYTVFTPFYKNAQKQLIDTPVPFTQGSFVTETPQAAVAFQTSLEAFGTPEAGGRPEALKILQRAADFQQYEGTRDFPEQAGTTRLSAHHKFGTVSARESWHHLAQALGADSGLVRQLYWRDFFTHIAWHFPHVFGQAFQKRFDAVPWKNNPAHFDAWCQGKTGFPIVDAGMRELNETGYMHNRARMITASFLTKNLHIDWRWGERYFAQKLVDYDPCVNNGSWQWAASTGCDAQPYFRIFNPWLQQQRFDPAARYIHRWVPELQGTSPRLLSKLEDSPQALLGYPAPIVQHKASSQHAKQMFAQLSSSA